MSLESENTVENQFEGALAHFAAEEQTLLAHESARNPRAGKAVAAALLASLTGACVPTLNIDFKTSTGGSGVYNPPSQGEYLVQPYSDRFSINPGHIIRSLEGKHAEADVSNGTSIVSEQGTTEDGNEITIAATVTVDGKEYYFSIPSIA